MFAVLSLLIIITISILITRVATLALTHTGLSKEAARFQARSAFTGAGFTTAESEKVVAHPVRRRVVLLLMLLGNAGVVTAVSSLILTFVDSGNSQSLAIKVVLLIAGLVALWALAVSPWVDRYLSRLIDRLLKRYTRLDVTDYASLMHLAGDYRIAELLVEPKDWLAYKTLTESELRDEGIVVLGVERADGTYLGAPKGDCQILSGDTLLLYGRATALEELDQRRKTPAGDWKHRQAVAEQKEVEQEERGHDMTESAAGDAGSQKA